MSNQWDNDGGDQTAYTERQVESILDRIGVEVEYDTENDFLCNCPFHGGRNTPSFSVSKTSGKYICFNAACDETGSLVDLVMSIGKVGPFPARRIILEGKRGDTRPLHERLRETFTQEPTFKEFEQRIIDKMFEDFWKHQGAQNYMYGRKFEEETLKHFKVGYSAKKNLIAVPMHDPDGMPVGVVGRTFVGEKRFRNSDDLPVKKTLWNYHRAKRAGDTVIVTEASFDAMRVHQAGYPNVVAVLGGNFNDNHIRLLDRTFTNIIIMSDFDDKKNYIYPNCKKCRKAGFNLCKAHNPGRDLGMKIVNGLPRKRISWASYEDGMVYPHGAKDAGDMTDDEIRQCLRNAVSNYIYQSWGLY